MQIYTEFTQALEPFKTIKYDICDLKSDAFDQDLNKFREKIEDLDKRIAYV